MNLRGKKTREGGRGMLAALLLVGLLLVGAASAGVLASAAHAQSLYFSQDGASPDIDEVFQADMEGTILPFGETDKIDPRGLVIDLPRRRVYWVERNGGVPGQGRILRRQIPGGATTEAVGGLTDVKDVEVLEHDGSLLYVADNRIFLLKRFRQVPKDVTAILQNRTGISTGTPENICVQGRTLFWTDSAGQRIGTATKRQGQVQASILNLPSRMTGDPRGIACDRERDGLYWTDLASDTVYRAAFDGSNASALIRGIGGVRLVDPHDVVANRVTGMVHATDTGNMRIVSSMPDQTHRGKFETAGPPVGIGVNGAIGGMETGEICSFGKPGSVLIWPYVNNEEGKTLITITNTNTSHVFCGGGVPDIFEGTVRLKLLFVHGEFCQVGNQIITLTPADTISVFLDELNVGGVGEEGWLMAVAVSALDDSETGLPELINFNHLIGSAQIFQTDADIVWAYDAYAFRGLTAEGETDDCGHFFTDHLNGNDNDRIDFDQDEYDRFPLVQSVPRIVEQPDGSPIDSFLAVMATNRGPGDDSEVNVLFFDNEEDGFSGDFDIRCFTAGDLVQDFSFLQIKDLGGNPNPEFPGEDPDSGWLTMFIEEDPDADTPAILSVFALIKDGTYAAGNNVFKEPPVIMRRQRTSFDPDLDVVE